MSAGYGESDPVISEEVVNTGFGQVLSGTVVICEGGARCAYSLGNTSGWSDLLMFYDDAHGPFSNAVYDTADKAVLFSVDESGFFSVSNFLANTQGLTIDGLVGTTEDATGTTQGISAVAERQFRSRIVLRSLALPCWSELPFGSTVSSLENNANSAEAPERCLDLLAAPVPKRTLLCDGALKLPALGARHTDNPRAVAPRSP